MAVLAVLWKHWIWFHSLLPSDATDAFIGVVAAIIGLIYYSFRVWLHERVQIYKILFVGLIVVGYIPDVFIWLNPVLDSPPVQSLERTSDVRGFMDMDDVRVSIQTPWYATILNHLPSIGFLVAFLAQRLLGWFSAKPQE